MRYMGERKDNIEGYKLYEICEMCMESLLTLKPLKSKRKQNPPVPSRRIEMCLNKLCVHFLPKSDVHSVHCYNQNSGNRNE